MDLEQAIQTIRAADEAERGDRATRLVELVQLLGDETIGFSGQAASWLFEDVKSTWLYGYFTATVVTAYALCLRQLAGVVLMLPDDPELPSSIDSLEDLASIHRLTSGRCPAGQGEVDAGVMACRADTGA